MKKKDNVVLQKSTRKYCAICLEEVPAYRVYCSGKCMRLAKERCRIGAFAESIDHYGQLWCGHGHDAQYCPFG